MAMQALRDGASSGLLKIFLMGMLVLAVGGLVLSDVGGFFRGGVSASDIVKIDNHTISATAFDQRARQALSRAGISPQQAYELGYIEEILRGEIASSILSITAADKGLLVGEDVIKSRLHDMIEPLIQDGQTAQDTLEQILRNQGMSEGQFVSALSQEIRNGLLSSALGAGFTAPPSHMITELIRFDGETRDIAYVSFTNEEMAVTKAPGESDLRAYYEEEKERFAIPERRDIRIIRIKDEALKETVEITDEELRSTYEDHIDAFSLPERRIVAQSIVTDKTQAQEIYAKASESGNLKTATAEVTGSDSAFVAPSAFQKDGLMEDIAAQIFAANKKGTIIEPVKTPLGWHVAQLVNMEAPRVQPFAEVSDALKDELMAERIIDEKYRLAGDVDDLLAGGASAEELGETIAVESIDVFGLTEANPQIPPNFAEQSATILEEAFALLPGEGSAVQETQDGILYVVFVDAVTPQAYEDFGEVRGALSEIWIARRQSAEAQAKALAYLTILETGETDLAAFATGQNKSVETMSGIARTKAPAAPLLPQTLNAIFDAPLDGYALIDVKGGIALAQVTDAHLPEIDADAPQTQIRRAEIRDNLTQAIASEAVSLYLKDRQDDYGVKVNRALIEQMYGPQTETY